MPFSGRTADDIVLKGLKQPVEVLIDPWGVPHIYARNSADLFFAQGYIAARDRLWQMEMWRRQGEGRLAEVLGEEAVERDRIARLLLYRGDMEAEWRSYAPDSEEIIEAFVRGVNAYMEQAKDNLPPEFARMGFRPEPWTPAVCLTRMAGYVMSGNVNNEVSRAQMVARLGLERTAELMPPDPPTRLEIPTGLDLKNIDGRVTWWLRGASAAPLTITRPLPAAAPPATDLDLLLESNNWTVAGSHTVTGKPMLANDPHRTIALPSLRYMAHLVAPGWNVIGAGEPSLPGIAVGHNERVGFGFTIFGADQQDLYVEETDPADAARYRYKDAWEPMRIIKDTVRVRGRATPVEVELRFTRHGPVIYEDRAAHRAYALRWSGLEPGGAGYLASISLDRARNWKEFLAALERWKLPPENLVYADVDGNIGVQSAGLVPRRRNWNGLLPVPGAGGAYEWDGFLKLDELPRSYNPAEGFIATANHRMIAADETKVIGYEWAPPDRFNRISEVLRSKDKFSIEDMEKLQHDEVSLPARQFVKMLPASVPEILRNWDARLDRGSNAAALYEVTMRKLSPKVFRGQEGAMMTGRASVAVMFRRLEKMPGAERASLLEETIKEAAAEVGSRTWGDLHKAAFNHPLAAQFNLPSVARGGDATTPNATSPNMAWVQTSGASFREVLDLADWDRSQAINVPGQSGVPGSAHYGDLLPLWGEGRYFPLLYSRPAIEAASKERLHLVPGPAK